MKTMFKFWLLAISLLVLRYCLSVIVGYNFPSYSLNQEETVLNESAYLNKRKPLYQLSNIWNKSQSIYFVEIAVNGYSQDAGTEGSLNGNSLYPLYSLTIKLFYKALPFINNTEAIYITGALLSAVFLGSALFYLNKLMDNIWLYEDQKYFVMIMLLVFPGSFFFNLLYSESLFLLLSVLFLYQLFRKKYFLSAVFLSLAAVTRLVGLVMIVPFLFYIFTSERYNKKFNFVSRSLSYLTMIFLPLAVFYYHLFEKSGDFFAALRGQTAIHNFLFIPFGYFFDLLNNLRPELLLAYILNALILLAALVLVGYLFVRIFLILEYKTLEQNTLFVYALVYVLLLSSLASTSTMFRYLSVCLPLFLLPASIFNTMQVRSKWFFMLSFGFLIFQTLFFIMFLTGIPAYVY